MLVTAEAVQGERWQCCQAQEAVPDVHFCIETGLVFRSRVRLPCCYQVQLVLIREIKSPDGGWARIAVFELASFGGYSLDVLLIDPKKNTDFGSCSGLNLVLIVFSNNCVTTSLRAHP